MDNDFSLDMDDIAATLRACELIAMRFVVIPERLLLDFRTSETDGPLVKVVAPVKSVEERYASLRVLRPHFPAPEKIVALWWPRFARSLRGTAAWETVMARVSASGHPDSIRQAAAALDELAALEAAQQRQAVRGEGFRTIWSASPAPR